MSSVLDRTYPREVLFEGAKSLLFDTERMASRAATYAIYGRKYHAPLYPTKVYHVDPSEIETIPVEKPRNPIPFVSGVKGGNWDVTTRRVEDDVVYRTFKQRFDQGRTWESTEYHAFMQDRLHDTSSDWNDYQTMDDVRRRYESLDELYRNLDRDGYVPQSDLQSDQLVTFPNKGENGIPLPPEFREISVYVGRDGELMWAAGMHRLCIAKIAGIDSIPVRIRIRHRIWQQHRDAVYQGDVVPDSHPDTRILSEE